MSKYVFLQTQKNKGRDQLHFRLCLCLKIEISSLLLSSEAKRLGLYL